MIKVISNKKIECNLSDCKRMQGILYNNGYDATITECFDWWDKMSHKNFSSWLSLPNDDTELFKKLVKIINK
jgi:hypothetical protein